MRIILLFLFLVLIVIQIAELYLLKKNTHETFNDSVDYVLTSLFMDGHIDADTYIAYTSMKSHKKYQDIHNIKIMESFKNGKLYSDYDISEKINSK
ncbi:MAG: hypothetical protein [Wendovervirus sonii]|uniref:Uncharacterized protein n=1 Tax=phage Lak_Megaphage_Sonny TaxID=3109229 RepID=A0ABZ0Z5Y2_9CAUD|nr:MAG: hypothetical protein [phage Lak_Megaphage_Sonny]